MVSWDRPRQTGLASRAAARIARRPDSPQIPDSPAGISQYLATAANAFDHAVKRRVLAIDWIVRITRQVVLRGYLIGPRLTVAEGWLRPAFVVRVRRWSWCGWISRTSRLRNRHRSVDQGQQRYRRDQLSHDGSPESGPLSRFMIAVNSTQISRFVQMFQARAGAARSESATGN